MRCSTTTFRRASISALLVAAIALASCGGSSAEERLSEEVTELRSEVLELRQIKHEIVSLKTDLAEVRARLASPPKAETKDREVITEKVWRPDGSHKDDPFLGAKDAPLLAMAFSDYQCRPCRSFFAENFDKLAAEFIDTQKLRFIYRDFPLQGNEHAVSAATFAHCVGEQGKYWQAHSLLNENQERVIAGDFSALERELLEVDADKLEKCRSNTSYLKEIAGDIEEGVRLGAQGAPAFFIGAPDESSGEYRGVFIRGAQPYELIRQEVLKLLRITGNAS